MVKVCASIRSSKVIIDWHNTGWSVLALRLGERSAVVRLAKWLVDVYLKWRDNLVCTDILRRQDRSHMGKKGFCSFVRNGSYEDSSHNRNRIIVSSLPDLFILRFSRPSTFLPAVK